ncbi:diguanylate cyclase [Pseudoalteromonas denitrificans]|uniref:diguanylate cyclase n=1 Tax=Pseudoalteromonas denitrificans DSM 6059 TaxID=1123010 RepID=A0A1I1GWF2_9GAMM|nr:diguanylate cyclase [Pseudoalteromonas denitrificans]SFC15825.1 diguanylate cyclase (GGDEF) domain-containing protein [Pseudoalteromonas denitrificans DSM 6059]
MTSKPIILIVDDSPTNIQLLAACVKDDYQLKVAKSGEQCLKLVSQTPKPDLILLDVEMPGMNGYQVCKILKSDDLTKSIPVIFVTGRQGDDDEEQGLKLGAVDYITKPIRPAIVIARVKTHITLKLQHDKLVSMALHDQLTGLYNRHYLLEVANQKVARALRHKYQLCLLMIDIDHFKLINDTHGHPAGDAVLKAVAAQISTGIREEDVVARFGGEEFVIIFDHCHFIDAHKKAEILLKEIEDLMPEGIKVTISIGLAKLLKADETFANLLKRSDLALYQAKHNGRNRIEAAIAPK